MRPSTAAALILVVHLGMFCGASSALLAAAEASGRRYPLRSYLEIHTPAMVLLGLVMLALAILFALLDRTGALDRANRGLRIALMDLRFPVRNPGRALQALREAVVQGQALVREIGGWTFVFRPQLPPAPEPGDPVWEQAPIRPHGLAPGSPISFNGGIAFREEAGRIRLAVLRVRKGPVLALTAFEIQEAVFRLLGVLRPTAIPDFARDPVMEDEAPEDLRPVLESVRAALLPTGEAFMDPEIARTAALSLMMGSHLSLAIGAALTWIAGASSVLAIAAGLLGGAGPALSLAAYRTAFRERQRAYEGLFGTAPVAGEWGRGLLFPGAAALLFPAAACSTAALIQPLLEVLSRSPEGQQTAGLMALLGILAAMVAVGVSAFLAGAAGRQDADRAVAGIRPPF